MRLIDANILEPHEQMEPMGNGMYEYVEVVYKDDIDDAPTIDAVPVVRCKDCVYCTIQNTKYNYAICQRHNIKFKPFGDDTRTHFCAWGERRTNGCK